MRIFRIASVAGIALGLTLVAPSLGAEPEPVLEPKKEEQPLPFEKLDVDDNGEVDPEEAELEPQLNQHFEAFDTNTDNRIDNAEYQEYKRF